MYFLHGSFTSLRYFSYYYKKKFHFIEKNLFPRFVIFIVGKKATIETSKIEVVNQLEDSHSQCP